jgi:D-sedoheptulose 7-phosphate isomerase
MGLSRHEAGFATMNAPDACSRTRGWPHSMPTDTIPVMDLDRLMQERLQMAARAVEALSAQREGVAKACRLLVETLDSGGTVLTCGNGGSAAEALHLAEELSGRYRSNRPALRGLSLCADPTALTCIANDFGFDHVFARQVEALGRAGDLLVVFSTSGKSANLVRALHVARERGITTLGLLGGEGGACLPLCDHAVVVHGVDGAGVQEAHQMIMHILCEACEARFAGGAKA